MSSLFCLVVISAWVAVHGRASNGDFTVTVTEDEATETRERDISKYFTGPNCKQYCESSQQSLLPDTGLAEHFGMAFSIKGPIAGKFCIRCSEPADPDGWWEMHYCSNEELGIRWDSGRRIAGMDCTYIYEPADPHTWDDNFMCVKLNNDFRFMWSFTGNPGHSCVQWSVPHDKHTWHDNFLCPVKVNREVTVDKLGMVFLAGGAVSGKKCIPMQNPKINAWRDASLCFDDSNYGVQWSVNGVIPNMKCTQVYEPSDISSWNTHFLCVPNTNPWIFHFDPQQPIEGLSCIKIGADPKWRSNYLCLG